MQDLIRKGFDVRDGKVYERGSYTLPKYSVQRVNTWGGGEEYRIDCGGYSIQKDSYGDWYLYDGYSKVCELRYYGGERWASYW